MRVVHAVSYFPKNGNWFPLCGGIERYVLSLSKYLVKKGHHLVVYTSKYPSYLGNEDYLGIRVERCFTPFIFNGFPFMPLYLLKLLKETPDVVHIHLNSPLVAEQATYAAYMRGVPIVVTLHAEISPEDVLTPSHGSRFLSKVYRDNIRTRILSKADKILLTSQRLEKTLERKFLEKVVIIPVGIDPKEKYNINLSRRVRSELKIDEQSKIILFVGRFAGYKGLEYLCMALKKVVYEHSEDVTCIFVGDGPLRGSVEELCIKLKLKEHTRFIGNVSDEELVGFYSIAHIFVLPSISASEAFGISQLEAMSFGVPVVASNVGGIPYLLKHDYNGVLVPPKNPEALAKAITKLLVQEDARNTLSRNAKAYVESNFLPENTWRRVEEIYHDVSKLADR